MSDREVKESDRVRAHRPTRHWVERFYRVLLGLYPRGFRESCLEDAEALFGDLRRAAMRDRGRCAAARFACGALIRALRGAVAERWQERREKRRPTVPGGSAPDGATHRDRGGRGLSALNHDLRYAVRSLKRTAGFSFTVILLVATGIGAATTVFSVVDGIVLRRLPYPQPDRLVYLSNGSHAPADFRDWQRVFESIDLWGGVWSERTDLTGSGEPERILLGQVTPDFFRILGARTSIGRLFVPDEYASDSGVAVVSHRFWRLRWAGDPDALGRMIRVGDKALTVVGVLPPDFTPPELMLRGATEVWQPLDLRDPEIQDRGLHVLEVVGRLAEAATLERAAAEMAAMDRTLAQAFPDTHVNRDGSIDTTPVLPLHEAAVGSVRGTLLLFLGAVGLLLLIACANVASLFLTKGAARRRELALRGALGATRRNMVTQLTVESLLLSLVGGAAGVGMAFGGVRLFQVLEPGSLPRAASVAVDGRVLLFAIGVALFTGLLFGLLPAVQAARTDVSDALREGSRQATVGRHSARGQSFLVMAEVALCTLLLGGAGILFHSYVTLTAVDVGFDSNHLITIDLRLPPEYTPQERDEFADALIERLQGLPGTQSVVAGATLPFQYATGGLCCWRTAVTPIASDGTVETAALMQPVTEGYFSGMGISLLSGRDLQAGDDRLDPIPVVANETLARELFGSTQAPGQELDFRDGRMVIVGVARDVHHVSYQREARPELYLPWKRFGPRFEALNIGMRTEATPGALAPGIREAVWALDPDLPVPDIVSMEGRMSRSVADERFESVLLGLFAAVALLLAACGIYATLLYAVRQREREMGIRLALGARAQDVVGLVLRRGLSLTAGGLVLGLAGATAAARLVESMVFGISPRDPWTLAAASSLLITVALIACLVPALRAGRTNPIETLRAE